MTRKQKKRLALLQEFRPDAPNIYDTEGFTPNGCGPEGKWYSCLIPDWWPGVGGFTVACDWHDYLYWVGGSEEDRAHADKELRRFLIWLVRKRSWFTRWRMLKIARLYYRAVSVWGTGSYNYIPPRS